MTLVDKQHYCPYFEALVLLSLLLLVIHLCIAIWFALNMSAN